MDDNGHVTRDRADRNRADITAMRDDLEKHISDDTVARVAAAEWRGEMNTKIDTLLDRTIRRRADSTKIVMALIGAAASIGVALIALLR